MIAVGHAAVAVHRVTIAAPHEGIAVLHAVTAVHYVAILALHVVTAVHVSILVLHEGSAARCVENAVHRAESLHQIYQDDYHSTYNALVQIRSI